MHGALIVANILADPTLRLQWEGEVNQMRQRIRDMRVQLCQHLTSQMPGRDFGFLLRQNGMFGYTGMSVEQVNLLRERHAVYAVASGRICVAGLNHSNLEYVSDAFAKVIRG
jgi:aromatic-amino-acid transaminase